MELIRVQAFAVPPGRLGGDRPAGGNLAITAQLRATLAESLADVPVDRQIQVAFRVDLETSQGQDSTRHNPVRELLLEFAFADAAAASTAASAIADRLCDATDQRSHPCLMVLSAARGAEGRQVSIWTFPQEPAFRFEPDTSLIQLLEDVFSQRSNLRKAAHFDGTERRDGFMVGWVVDLQASAATVSVADYWIRRFLDCELMITPGSGTRLLARALRDATDRVADPEARNQLTSAAAHLPHQPRERISIADVADMYLSGEARVAFEGALPAPALARTPFNLDRAELERGLGLRVYELETGVRVTSPVAEVGRSVRVDREVLTCTGRVVSERLRTERRG